jgi:hypothetical protein
LAGSWRRRTALERSPSRFDECSNERRERTDRNE